MFTILLHSSKTMRAPSVAAHGSVPLFIDRATELAQYMAGLDVGTIARVMKISDALASKTLSMMQSWEPRGGAPAIDSFIGDIYSGLQVGSLTDYDRAYANQTLVILSGLYGALRPLDLVHPYRLEMAYKFPDNPYANLYDYWGESLARSLPEGRTIINTSSVEYTKVLFPYLDAPRILTPKFLTVSPKTGEPTFVTVHAKIARGAFARWLITERIEDEGLLSNFKELGYAYDIGLSTEFEPVFVAKSFGGLGLSVRLK